MGNYCFVPYVVLLAVLNLFMYLKVPETKNKPIMEIVAMFYSTESLSASESDGEMKKIDM